MRIYLEALEQVAMEYGEAEFVRLDVTGKSQAEQDAILVSLKDFMSGLICIFRKHFCLHDVKQPCLVEEI